MDVSLSFICGSTSARIDGGAFSYSEGGGGLSISLTPVQAPESCKVIYWDPLITPMRVDSSSKPLSGDGTLSVAVVAGATACALAAVVVAFRVYKHRTSAKAKDPAITGTVAEGDGSNVMVVAKAQNENV